MSKATKIPAVARAKKGECIDLLDSDDDVLLPAAKKAKVAASGKPRAKAEPASIKLASKVEPGPIKQALKVELVSAVNPPSTTLATATATSSSAQDPLLRADGYPKWMDFIDTTGKPAKYSKRMMGETKKLYSEDGRKSQEDEGIIFIIPKGLSETQMFDLGKWEVLLRTDRINQDSQLARDLKKHKLEGVYLEMQIPNEYPMQPPFVRIRHPKLSGGYVFEHGAICFEPLTPKGWPVAMTLMSLVVAIKGIFDYNPVSVSSVGDVTKKTIPGYSEEGARRDYKTVLMAHEGGRSWHSLNGMSS